MRRGAKKKYAVATRVTTEESTLAANKYKGCVRWGRPNPKVLTAISRLSGWIGRKDAGMGNLMKTKQIQIYTAWAIESSN